MPNAMRLIINDKKDGTLIRTRCPNCSSPNPIVKSGIDWTSVLYPACGAHEKVEDGKVTLSVACRIKP